MRRMDRSGNCAVFTLGWRVAERGQFSIAGNGECCNAVVPAIGGVDKFTAWMYENLRTVTTTFEIRRQGAYGFDLCERPGPFVPPNPVTELPDPRLTRDDL